VQARRKFILVPLGSAGDVLPFVWLGEGLREAGHDVVAVVQSPYLIQFKSVRVRAVGFGSIEDHEVVIRHPDLWHPRRGLGLIARVSATWHRLATPLIRNEVVAGRTTVVAAGLAFAGRVVAEAESLPLVTVQLQPLAFLSVQAPPLLRPGWERLATAPIWVRRVVYRLAYWQTDWLWAETVNSLRAEAGLPQPVKQVLRSYWVSPQRIVALFPEWFAPKATDWPIQTVTTRFPLADPLAGRGLSPDVETFLGEGAPPVVFTPGSANAQASHFFQVATEACRLAGCRGLLATPYTEQVPRNLPLSVRHFSQVSFTHLFPRCRAVVHHGGIGTTSHVLAAGVPQLIVPLSHDQPDNAARVKHLGVGDRLYPAELHTESLATGLRRLAASKDVGRACRDVRARFRQQMDRAEVVRLIEEIV